MEIVDWEATIKYLEGIDIVVTIDSSMAHLCGSLGKPCIVLMPLFDSDFRWGDSSMGTKNVWYDSVKVIRNDNNWEKVFDSVERELSAWVQLPSSWTA
jgi:ADP-heptose:LPS heptosyltransferase